MALLLAKAKMGPKRLKRATAVRFWCSWYPTQYFWIRPVILDRFQGPGRSFSDQKLGLKSKSGFSGHPRYLRPKLRTSDQNALKQTGSEGPQNLSMGFWHVKHQFYLPAQKCSNLTHPTVYVHLQDVTKRTPSPETLKSHLCKSWWFQTAFIPSRRCQMILQFFSPSHCSQNNSHSKLEQSQRPHYEKF